MAESRRDKIRSRAAQHIKISVPIELDDETVGEEEPTKAPASATKTGHSANGPTTAVPAGAQSPANAGPPPENTPPPTPSPVPKAQHVAGDAVIDRQPRREGKKVNMIIGGRYLDLLETLSRSLEEARRDQSLKGQLGATILAKIGLLLASQLSPEELYELARRAYALDVEDKAHE